MALPLGRLAGVTANQFHPRYHLAFRDKRFNLVDEFIPIVGGQNRGVENSVTVEVKPLVFHLNIGPVALPQFELIGQDPISKVLDLAGRWRVPAF